MITDLNLRPIYHCHHHSDPSMTFIAESVTKTTIKDGYGRHVDDFDVLTLDGGVVDLCRGEVDEYNPDIKSVGSLSFEVLMLSLMSDKI